MSTDLELIAERDGERTVLRCPGVGFFTLALDAGALLGPGAPAGSLSTLGRSRTLRVPADVAGRVVSARPERVRAPVAYRDVLYELEAIGAAVAAPAAEAPADTATGLAVRAPHAGRFWHRPSPSEPAFCDPGAALEPGTAVGLIEVMKTFGHVPYAAKHGCPPRARFVRYLVGDGAEVGEGDPLCEVEAS